MDLNEDEVEFHYMMLEYVYEQNVLPASCHNFVWEKFKNLQDANPVANQLSSGKKTLDWCEIASLI